MKINMSVAEFKALRECVVHTNSDAVTDVFNNIFGGKYEEVKTSLTNTVNLDIDSGKVIELFGVLDKHISADGPYVKSSGSLVMRAIAGLGPLKIIKDNLWGDIKGVFKK